MDSFPALGCVFYMHILPATQFMGNVIKRISERLILEKSHKGRQEYRVALSLLVLDSWQ